MKILYVINSLCSGGAEKLVNDLLPLLNSEKNVCHLLYLSDKHDKYSDNLKDKGISVTLVPSKSHLKRISYIQQYIKKYNIEIVHAHLFPSFYYCSFVKKITKKSFKLIMTEHNTSNRRRKYNFLKLLEKYMYFSYDHIISITQETQSSLFDWIEGYSSKKMSVINNGIPLEDFYNASKYERNQLIDSISENDILMCMVGSFTEQKNHELMIKIMNDLPINFKIVLVGEGALEKSIRCEVVEKKLSSKVFFLGYRNDIPNIMKTADIILIPSKWEGFGLVAVESLATGTQIVASNVPGMSSVLGNAGFKVNDNANHQEFIDKIQLAIDRPIHRSTLINRSKIYDINNMKDQYINLYNKIGGN